MKFEERELLTLTEAAGIVGKSRQTLHTWRKKKKFPDPVCAVKGIPYYTRSQIADWKEKQKVTEKARVSQNK